MLLIAFVQKIDAFKNTSTDRDEYTKSLCLEEFSQNCTVCNLIQGSDNWYLNPQSLDTLLSRTCFKGGSLYHLMLKIIGLHDVHKYWANIIILSHSGSNTKFLKNPLDHSKPKCYFRWTKGICNAEKFSNTLDRNNLFPSFIFNNFIYFAVDTTPQFETREFNATENKNASFELPFSALDKERVAAIVSLVIVKGW